jgi:hypothetical protein
MRRRRSSAERIARWRALREKGRPADVVGVARTERWFQAWLEKDAETVERLAAEDYIDVAPNGSILDRLALLAIIRSPSYRLDHGTRTEVVVRAVGHDAAVVRHHYPGAGSFEDASFTDGQRCVMISEKQAGEWRLMMEQCSFSSK